MDFLELAVAYGKPHVGNVIEDEQEQSRLFTQIPSNMQQLLENARTRAETEDHILATLGAVHWMDRMMQSDPDNEEGLLGRVGRWLAKEAAWIATRGVARVIFMGLWRAVKWLAFDVVGGALSFVARSLLVPLLEGVVAVVMAPEVLIAAAIIAGVAGLGWVAMSVLRRFFPETAEKISPTPPAPSSAQVVPTPVGAAPSSVAGPVRGGVGDSEPLGRLKALISRGEGDYNSVNYSARSARAGRAGHEDLIHMTVAQIQHQQDIGNYNAVGRYQFIRGTLASVVHGLGINPQTTMFDQAFQNRAFEYMVTQVRTQVMRYVRGQTDDLWGAVLALSQEWASVAAPAGYRIRNGQISDGRVSYYDGIQGNRASISAQEMANVLQAERATYGQGANVLTPSTTIAATSRGAPQATNGTARPTPSTIAQNQPQDRTLVRGPRNTTIALNSAS
ncbi:hypothetical protein [Ralstonia phage phiRSL1]|uniref:Uncharacterized protein n=1 Tax=Ralstonia phage phiRSL1 TaxID=1980924 RepID=B2ZYI5_9CAUD|nr:hypothetical protein RSL1_ORF204 [Ralstonia phage phiRSL1]BAG41653.1 hypothetical protein [Ralstonia phage phiRSL1]